MNTVKIVIDCFGADNSLEIIKGCVLAVNEIENVTLLLSGDENKIQAELDKYSFEKERIVILPASEVITNNDEPVNAIRTKKNSSLCVGLNKVKEDEEIKAFISAGSTGALLAGTMLCLGRSYLLDRPILASLLPADNGGYVCLADCGANVDSKPNQLLSFAKYGSLFVKSYLGIENPKVALLSVGTEDKKGNAVTKEAFQLLKESDLNFVGNIEGKTVLGGEVDVVVCDGFSGNVLLKNIEGTAKSVIGRLNGIIKKIATPNDDLTVIKKSFKELMKQLDFNSEGGAVILGVKKIIIKAHGSAESITVVNTVKQALKMLDGGFEKYFNN